MRVKLDLVLDVGDAAADDAKAYLADRRGQIPPGDGNGELGLVQEAALDLFQAALADSPLDWWEVDRSSASCVPHQPAR